MRILGQRPKAQPGEVSDASAGLPQARPAIATTGGRLTTLSDHPAEDRSRSRIRFMTNYSNGPGEPSLR
jgi:hypothetical protein